MDLSNLFALQAKPKINRNDDVKITGNKRKGINTLHELNSLLNNECRFTIRGNTTLKKPNTCLSLILRLVDLVLFIHIHFATFAMIIIV